MRIAQSRLTAQGQISVPTEVRRRLGLGPGALLEWDAQGDDVLVRRVGSHGSEDVHRVLFPKEPKPRSLEELDDGIRRAVKARHARG